MRRALTRSLLAVAIAALAVAGSALAQPLRQTTAQVQINPGGAFDPAKPGFFALGPVAGQKPYLRELPGARAQANRSKRRTSRTYFAALNDFQLADEESPARIDSLAPVQPNTSAWRPQEALMPQTIDATLRRLNQFTAASPNSGAKGRRARMDLALIGGDNSDNQQENENTWVRQLLEGGQTVDPNSGIADYSSCTPQQRDRACSSARPTRPRATPASRTTTTTTTARATATSTTRPGPPACTAPGPSTRA